jgi:NADPH:quinone reductase-like Zn-dependent oxidoreductase
MIRKGQYPDVKENPPFSLGYDLVGEIDRVGPGVEGLKAGDRVADLTVIGAQAEYVCLDAADLVPVPRNLDPVQAVSLVLSYTTAYQMLTRKATVRAGERILVHGAGGAVGTALVQLGKRLNLEVYGTASRSKHELIDHMGAHPIDYHSEDFVRVVQNLEEPGVDAAFDHLGGQHFKRSLDSLRRGGRLVAYGFYNATMGKGGSVILDFAQLFLWNLLPNGKSASFYSIGPWRKKHPDWFQQDLSELFELCSEGEIHPVIWKTITLEEIPQAHRWIAQAESEGKIVVDLEANR